MQQISLPNPKPKRPRITKRNHLKKQGSYSAQPWQKTYLPQLEEEKEQTKSCYT
jgi:hypothetical protein